MITHAEALNQIVNDQLVPFDLSRGFSDERLTGAGELEVFPRFQGPIIIALGGLHDLLAISRVSPIRNDTVGFGEADSLYELRNLGGDGSIMLDNALGQVGALTMPNGGQAQAWGSRAICIGTDMNATPELGFSSAVRPMHLAVRIGAVARNIHFADLSGSATVAYLTPFDASGVRRQRREWASFPDATREAATGAWSRKGLYLDAEDSAD